MNKQKKKKKIFFSFYLVLIWATLVTLFPTNTFGAAENNTDSQAIIQIGEQISIKSYINKQPLGIKFQINEYGSVRVEMINNSSEELSIGTDLFVLANNSKSFNIALAMPSNNPIPQDQLSEFVYACGVNNFSKIKEDGVLWAFGPGGDWINFNGVTETYEGNWPKTLFAQSKTTIEHRLATWPGSNRGWIATPVLSVKDGPSFRILSEFGKKNKQPIVVPMDANSLKGLISNHSIPLALREWAACWLASLPEKDQWKSAVELLSDKNINIEIRKALARSLSTQSPAEALDYVNKILWDKTEPIELRLISYYSFTWSDHPEAKILIKKAVEHPDKKISDNAKSRISSSN